MRAATMVGTVLAISGALGACGGAGVSKAGYVGKADAICAAAETSLGQSYVREVGPTDQPPNPTKAPVWLRNTFIPAFEKMLADLRALKGPKGDAATIRAVYDSAAQALEGIKADPSKFFSGGYAFAHASERAKAHGMTRCFNPQEQ